MSPAVKITGLAEVQKMLANAPKSVVARGYVNALSRGIGVIRAALDEKTPVRESEEFTAAEKGDRHPGDLKRGLTTEVILDSQFRGGVAKAGYSGFQGHVANFLEYGHRIVKKGGFYTDSRGRRRKGTVTGFVDPHPFMRDAFDISADAAIDAFAESLVATLKEGL